MGFNNYRMSGPRGPIRGTGSGQGSNQGLDDSVVDPTYDENDFSGSWEWTNEIKDPTAFWASLFENIESPEDWRGWLTGQDQEGKLPIPFQAGGPFRGGQAYEGFRQPSFYELSEEMGGIPQEDLSQDLYGMGRIQQIDPEQGSKFARIPDEQWENPLAKGYTGLDEDAMLGTKSMKDMYLTSPEWYEQESLAGTTATPDIETDELSGGPKHTEQIFGGISGAARMYDEGMGFTSSGQGQGPDMETLNTSQSTVDKLQAQGWGDEGFSDYTYGTDPMTPHYQLGTETYNPLMRPGSDDIATLANLPTGASFKQLRTGQPKEFADVYKGFSNLPDLYSKVGAPPPGEGREGYYNPSFQSGQDSFKAGESLLAPKMHGSTLGGEEFSGKAGETYGNLESNPWAGSTDYAPQLAEFYEKVLPQMSGRIRPWGEQMQPYIDIDPTMPLRTMEDVGYNAKDPAITPTTDPSLPLKRYLDSGAMNVATEDERLQWLNQQSVEDLGANIEHPSGGVLPEKLQDAWSQYIGTHSRGAGGDYGYGETSADTGAWLSMPGAMNDPTTADGSVDPATWARQGKEGATESTLRGQFMENIDPALYGQGRDEVYDNWKDWHRSDPIEDTYDPGVEARNLGPLLSRTIEGPYGPIEEKRNILKGTGGVLHGQQSTFADAMNKWSEARGDVFGKSSTNLTSKLVGSEEGLLEDYITGRGTAIGGPNTGLRGKIRTARGDFMEDALETLKTYQGPRGMGGQRKDVIDRYITQVEAELGSDPGSYSEGEYKTEREKVLDTYKEDYGEPRAEGGLTGLIPKAEEDLESKQSGYLETLKDELGRKGFSDTYDQARETYEKGLTAGRTNYEQRITDYDRARNKAVGRAKLDYKDVRRDIDREISALDAEATADRRTIRGFQGAGLVSGRRGRVGGEEYQKYLTQKQELLKEKDEAKKRQRREMSGARTEFTQDVSDENIAAEIERDRLSKEAEDEIFRDAEAIQEELYEHGGAEATMLEESQSVVENLASEKAKLEGAPELLTSPTKLPGGTVGKAIADIGIASGEKIMKELGREDRPMSGTAIGDIGTFKMDAFEGLFGKESSDLSRYIKERGIQEDIAEVDVEEAGVNLLGDIATDRGQFVEDVESKFQDAGTEIGKSYEDYKAELPEFKLGGQRGTDLGAELRGGATGTDILSAFQDPFSSYAKTYQDRFKGKTPGEGWQPEFIPQVNPTMNLWNVAEKDFNMFGQPYRPAQVSQTTDVPGKGYHYQHGAPGWGRDVDPYKIRGGTMADLGLTSHWKAFPSSDSGSRASWGTDPFGWSNQGDDRSNIPWGTRMDWEQGSEGKVKWY